LFVCGNQLIGLKEKPTGLIIVAIIVLGIYLTPVSFSASSSMTTSAWQKIMGQTPTPGLGCYDASYPSTNWISQPCSNNDTKTIANVGGCGTCDWMGFRTLGNYITNAQGSVTSESTFVSEYDSYSGIQSDFSIQLNSNEFPFTYQGKSTTGWEQFLYQVASPTTGNVYITYWLVNYSSVYGSCPSGWFNDGSGNCYQKSSEATFSCSLCTQGTILSELTSASLSGQVSSTADKVTFCFKGACTSSSGGDVISLSSLYWFAAEWNIFGQGGGSQAVFGSPFSLTITTFIYNRIRNTICGQDSYTTESNNLNLGSCSSSTSSFTFSESV
jgi:hypothetical protein